MRYLITTIACLFSLMAMCNVDAFAADTAAVEEQAVTPSADMEQRLALSQELHKYISVTERINGAIDAVSLQLPEAEQEKFRSSMRSILNYRVIEKASVDTMAELFTADELKYLIEYHKNPMSKSVEEKFAIYEEKLSPEITRMLDKSMMRVRTGGDSMNPN